MIPVDCQTIHNPPTSYGDCLRAVIASLLDLGASDVPHFYHDGCDADIGDKRLNEWLASRNLCTFSCAFPGEMSLKELLQNLRHHGGCHYILFGALENGEPHVVICRDGEIVHNPSWTGQPIIAPIDDVWVVMVLVVR